MPSFHYRAEITAHTYSYRFWNAERKRILCHGNAITRNTYGRGVNMTSKCSLSCNYNQYCRHRKLYYFKNNMTLICQLNLDCNSIQWCKNSRWEHGSTVLSEVSWRSKYQESSSYCAADPPYGYKLSSHHWPVSPPTLIVSLALT